MPLNVDRKVSKLNYNVVVELEIWEVKLWVAMKVKLNFQHSHLNVQYI